MDEGDPQAPIIWESGSEEASQGPSNHGHSPTIPTEDSYFAEGAAQPRPFGFRDFRHLGVILNNRRRQTQQGAFRGAGAAWIDQDDSGTYDPCKERATPLATPIRRVKRSRRQDNDDEGGLPRPKPQKSHRPVGYRPVLIFSFASKKSLEYLKSISLSLFGHQSATPDDQSEVFVEGDDNDLFGPPLHCSKTRRSTKQRKTLPRDDGLTIDQLTLGHPQRRGCKSCFEVGNDECSLIGNTYEYPCMACDDAGFDCELIIPPEFKKSCERCKQKRTRCSYSVDGGKGVDSCDACAEAELKCLAAPLKSSVSLGRGATVSCSPVPSPRPAPPRVYASCNQCRNNGRGCNLKKGQQGPCRHCKKIGEDCAFVLIPPTASNIPLNLPPPPPKPKRRPKKGGRKPKRRTKKQQRPRGKSRRKPNSQHDFHTPGSPPLGTTAGIQHITIKTSFSHPIKFNYFPDPMGTSPCSWCSSPFFGLFGHGELEVEVIPYPQINGYGYEEMPGGHAHNQIEGSQMCVRCTFERVQIMSCENHVFGAIEVDPRVHVEGEMDRSIQALLVNDKKGGELAEKTKWCSICPAPAFFECCARQMQDSEAAEDVCGCGLHLCEQCNDLFEKIARDSANATEALNRTIHFAAKDLFSYELGVRADASFLTSKGELKARIDRGYGEGPLVEKMEDGTVSSDGEDGEDGWAIFDTVKKGKGRSVVDRCGDGRSMK